MSIYVGNTDDSAPAGHQPDPAAQVLQHDVGEQGTDSVGEISGNPAGLITIRAAINGGFAEDAEARTRMVLSTADVPGLAPGSSRIDRLIGFRYSGTEPSGLIDDISVAADATFSA